MSQVLQKDFNERIKLQSRILNEESSKNIARIVLKEKSSENGIQEISNVWFFV
jgi:hypothetical protein